LSLSLFITDHYMRNHQWMKKICNDNWWVIENLRQLKFSKGVYKWIRQWKKLKFNYPSVKLSIKKPRIEIIPKIKIDEHISLLISFCVASSLIHPNLHFPSILYLLLSSTRYLLFSYSPCTDMYFSFFLFFSSLFIEYNAIARRAWENLAATR